MVTKIASRTGSSGREGNGLAVLANKCAARTFDISSGMIYASMRDQIARAQLLVRDLKKADPACRSLLVIGAGVAGASAAIHASSQGMKVVVLETRADAFELQAAVTSRIVGPFMYEWPGVEIQSQSYPSVLPSLGAPHSNTATWSSVLPLPASELATQLRAWLKAQLAKQKAPRFFFNVLAHETRTFVDDFVNAAGSGGAITPPHMTLPPKTSRKDPIRSKSSYTTFIPDYVILAVGMGEERVHLIDGKPNEMRGLPFWQNDDLRSPSIPNMEVAVFGAGDGALQDVLRVLTKHDHPLNFVQALSDGDDSIKSRIERIKPQLASLEQQSRLFATCSTGPVFELIDKECEKLCRALAEDPQVKSKVLSELRVGTGVVHHVYREQYLTRAYLLNRFCIHLIHACQPASGTVAHMRYIRRNQTAAVAGTSKSTPAVPGEGGLIKLSSGSDLNVQKLVVRFGPDKEWLDTNKMVKLSPEIEADRVKLSAIPLPYVVST